MENERLIYSAILRKKHTILTEFTDCSGNFSQITVSIMDEVINTIEIEPDQYKAKFNYGKYVFYILKDYKIYILSMISSNNHIKNTDNLFFNFLFDIHEDISKNINFNNPGKLNAYSLSSYSLELKSKFIQFNKGEIKFNDKLINKKNNFTQFELLNNKVFSQDKKFPILSNEQVHADKNIIPKEDIDYNINREIGGTIDSFKDDILLGNNSSQDNNNKNNEENAEELLMCFKGIEETEFDKNFKLRKRKKSIVKIIIPISIVLIIILVLVIYFCLN